MPDTTLVAALAGCDMLIVDDLHAFEFDVNEKGLQVRCMVGNKLQQWRFSPDQLAAAQPTVDADTWLLNSEQGEHRLACISAFHVADDDGLDEADDEAAADPAQDETSSR